MKELCAGTETQAVGINILLSANSTLDAEFLPFDFYEIINFFSAAFTFSHIISPSNSDLSSLKGHLHGIISFWIRSNFAVKRYKESIIH